VFSSGKDAPTVAIIVKGFPRLSESFVAQEILGLERAGLRIRIYSLRNPTDKVVNELHHDIRAPVTYLPEYLFDDWTRVVSAWRVCKRFDGYFSARRAFAADFARDPTPNRVRRFGQALVLAREIPQDVGRLHAHFLHTPTSVARYAAMIKGLPFSAAGHAKDIWTTPTWDLRQKIADAAFVTTCNRAGLDRLTGIRRPTYGDLFAIPHGLDQSRFPRTLFVQNTRDGRSAQEPVRILTVGRLVAKKGFATLFDALARLPKDLHWTLTHAGAGPLGEALAQQAKALGLDQRIEFLGAKTQQDLLALYRAADLFALPCEITNNGDRDGIPNVLLEAGSQGLACVSTKISAIPELIETNRNGVLTAPNDPTSLARALEGLCRDPKRRRALGAQLQVDVAARFNFDDSIKRVANLFSAPANARRAA
jgi:glycosyltransferase involved in cell wall biosynthesis